jgi:hypothetical protein
MKFGIQLPKLVMIEMEIKNQEKYKSLRINKPYRFDRPSEKK